MTMRMKQRRLRGTRNIAAVFSGIRPTVCGAVSVRCLRRDGEPTKFAIAIPGSASPRAVRRNALRRKIREILRRLSDRGVIREGFDVAIVVRAVAYHQDVETALAAALGKSGILEP